MPNPNNLPKKVRLVEVGPRDGLQNEAISISVADKVQLIQRLSQAGLREIEAGSFVSPKWVPQMADSALVLKNINRHPKTNYSALTPNLKGYQEAKSAKADSIAVFASASESFSQKNINCSIQESIVRFSPIFKQAKLDGIPVRAYVSCVIACPYEGRVANSIVLELSKALLNMGAYEVSLGDTIGVGTPKDINNLLSLLLSQIPSDQLALHCHDTYGQALVNVYAALQQGLNTFDASVAGLGGCPYAKGASGNLASEDLVYMLDNMNIKTGVDLKRLCEVGQYICHILHRQNQAKCSLGILA